MACRAGPARLLVAVLAALISPAPAPFAAEEAPEMRRERLGRLGVELDVPAAWDTIDPDDLDSLAAALVEATGGILAESYQYGFGARTPDGYAYPCVLVQVKDIGRVGHRQFLELPPVERLRREGAGAGSAADLGLGAPPYLREVGFDRSRFCLRLTSTVPVLAGEPVVALSGAFLTERGFLIVHGFDRLAGFERSRPVFERVLASVELPEGLRYQPRVADRWPGLARVAGWRGALVAAVAVLGGLAAFLLLRRRGTHERRH